MYKRQDGGLVGVRRGQAVLDGQAVGAHDRDVDAGNGKRRKGLGPHGGLGDAADLTAEYAHAHVVAAGQERGGQNRVGDDREVEPAGKTPGQGADGGAGVEQDSGVMTQMEVRERRLGDRLLGGGADEFALGDAGLRQGCLLYTSPSPRD